MEFLFAMLMLVAGVFIGFIFGAKFGAWLWASTHLLEPRDELLSMINTMHMQSTQHDREGNRRPAVQLHTHARTAQRIHDLLDPK